jgi:hypothetical protein
MRQAIYTIILSGCLLLQAAPGAGAAPTATASWKSEADTAKALSKRDPRGAALHLIKCMQLVRQQKGAGTDEKVKSLFLNDMNGIIFLSDLVQADRIKLAEWEFATAQTIFGAYSPYACLALADIAGAKADGDYSKIDEFQPKMTRQDLLEFLRLQKVRQAQLAAAINETSQKVNAALDKLK